MREEVKIFRKVIDQYAISEGTYDNSHDLYCEIKLLLEKACLKQRQICTKEAQEWWDLINSRIPLMGKYPNGLKNDIKNSPCPNFNEL